MKIALVGNQNCGKTTLFNVLTGANQHVGNFPGVTVTKKKGIIKDDKDYEIWDLPGIYSLSAYSIEEIVTREFIIKEDIDLILNIIDVTNMERNLYLTMQLLELEKPMIIALNMMDEMLESGHILKVEALSTLLGVKCYPIVANKNDGIKDLISAIKKAPQTTPKRGALASLAPYINPVKAIIKEKTLKYALPLSYAATQLLLDDKALIKELKLDDKIQKELTAIREKLVLNKGYDALICLVMARYEYIDTICGKVLIRKNNLTKKQLKSQQIDKLLTHRFLAYPLFFIIMSIIFYLTFVLIGGNLQEAVNIIITNGIACLMRFMVDKGFNEVVTSLLCQGILTGIGSMLSFLPIIITLFFFLSLLEDSGYMARIAFIMDKPLRKIGLSGRSFVPMLMGFGCSVPAVMSTRTLTNKKDRLLTIMLIPFMPCTAKLPLFITLCAAFFGGYRFWIIVLLYLTSIFLGIVTVAIIQLLSPHEVNSFVMELPSYRLPTFKNTVLLMCEKAKDFLKKAFTIIFVASLLIWFLSSFSINLSYVKGMTDKSLLAQIAKVITPIFRPFGVKNYEVTSALLAGLSAKEAVISTLEILHFNLDCLSLLEALSLLLFALLYMPCIATFSVISKELRSYPLAILFMVLQTAIAYFVATIFYQIGCWLEMNYFILQALNLKDYFILAVVVILLILAVIYMVKHPSQCDNGACKECLYRQTCKRRKKGYNAKK